MRNYPIAILVTLLISVLLVIAGSQGNVLLSGLPLFTMAACLTFLLHWLMFLPAYAFQTERFFDLTGSACFVAATLLALIGNPETDARRAVLAAAMVIWALRLGSFLYWRVQRHGGDRRFDEIKPNFPRFLFAWTMSAAWVTFTAGAGLAAIAAPRSVPVGVLFYLGLGLWLAGFAIEVVADRQKTAFRRREGNQEAFIRSGLWAWSRHPNYFGEITLWCGIALMALPALSGWQHLTLVSPLFVFLLLTRLSGIPTLEAQAERKWGDDPGWRNYKATTPVLLPRPWR